jgi:hypothetical protein
MDSYLVIPVIRVDPLLDLLHMEEDLWVIILFLERTELSHLQSRS